jgi:hypothetical protein
LAQSRLALFLLFIKNKMKITIDKTTAICLTIAVCTYFVANKIGWFQKMLDTVSGAAIKAVM